MRNKAKFMLAVAMVICSMFTLAKIEVKCNTYSPDFSAILMEDDTLWIWGFVTDIENHSERVEISFCPAPTKILNHVDSISVDNYTVYAVKTDGSLWLWSELFSYESFWSWWPWAEHSDFYTPLKVMDDVASVSADNHLMVIRTDGSLWVRNGNLGMQEKQFFDPTNNKMWLKAMDNVIFAQSGYAIKADGSLWDLQINFDSNSGTFTATPIKVMDDVICASATKAVKSDGSLWSWGSNTSGEVGDGTMTEWGYVDGHYTEIRNNDRDRSAPVKILDDVALVSECVRGAIAVKTDGSLWVWGEDRDGRFGIGGSWGYQTTPVKIADGVAYAELFNSHMMVIKQDGSLWTCGSNEFGQLGNGITASNPQIYYFAQNGTFEYVELPTRPYLEKVMDGIKIPSNAVKPTITVMFKGERLNLTLPILNVNGRTMYPFRECLEAMGANVSWAAETKTAKGMLGGQTVEFIVGSGAYKVNGKQMQMDAGVTSFIKDGRIYIPIRYAAEALGFTVEWDEATQTVNIK